MRPACGTDRGELTTSFLSICGKLKDNRLLPTGFLPLDSRVADLARRSAPVPTWPRTPIRSASATIRTTATGGARHADLPRAAAPTSPASAGRGRRRRCITRQSRRSILQDRFCTAKGADRDRLRFVTSQLKLDGTRAANWKLHMVRTGPVAVR